MGVVINKVKDENISLIAEELRNADVDVLGTIPFDEKLALGTLDRKSVIVNDAVKQFYFRLNLPQENR